MRLRSTIIGFAALALSWVAWRDAAANVWLANRSTSPPGMALSDPRVALARDEGPLLQPPGAKAQQAAAIATQAQAVLRASPLEPNAMRDFAVALETIGAPGAKQKLLLAERISRRDRHTQNQLLVIAATEGAYGPSIDHLDKLLSVSPHTAEIFRPAMTALVADPMAQDALAARSDRPWFPSLISAAVKTSPEPDAVAALLTRSRGLPETERAAILPHMLNRFLADGRYGAARDFAVGFGRIRPADFASFDTTERTSKLSLGNLAWQFVSDGTVQADLVPGHGVDVQVEPGAVSVVMNRLTLFPPGRYAFQEAISQVDASPDIFLQWELSCYSLKGHPRVWQQQIPLRSHGKPFAAKLELPAGCDAQMWRLKVFADDAQLPSSFRIEDLSLKPD